MKETGLMFKAPLVRAILSGQKTQTRRPLNPQPAPNHPHDAGTVWTQQDGLHVPVGSVGHLTVKEKMGLRCPMGQPGDRIYVRETWRGVVNIAQPGSYEYAVARYVPDQEHCRRVEYAATQAADGEPWRPAIHMPKWAARIWLEITGVRVERLQAISEGDAMAEGIERMEDFIGCPCWKDYSEPEGPDAAVCPDDPIGSFQTLWDSTTGRPALPKNENSKRYARVKHWLDTHPDTTGWAANPWVWVIDFKRIEKP